MDLLPYTRHSIDDADAAAVAEALRSAWLTGGPLIERFERAVAARTGARHGVAVSSGTAALHAAVAALGIGPEDEVIVPAITFASTATVVLLQGARPVFADVDPKTLLIDPASVAARATPRTKAVIAVDYAGQPCDYARLRAVTAERGIRLLADGCHALGASDAARPVGTLADATAFSFHPAKHITTGEGGMLVTDDEALAARARRFRNHGIDADPHRRLAARTWVYEIAEPGLNYRISDFQCALGLSQLAKLQASLARRRAVAAAYDRACGTLEGIAPLEVRPGVEHAYHLYVVRLDRDRLGLDRAEAFRRLHEEGIGVNVHYIPVHLQPLYRTRLGTGPGLCPAAEAAYERIVSLPMFPGMTDGDIRRVVSALERLAPRPAPSGRSRDA